VVLVLNVEMIILSVLMKSVKRAETMMIVLIMNCVVMGIVKLQILKSSALNV